MGKSTHVLFFCISIRLGAPQPRSARHFPHPG
jgi:hypothetical protein